MRRRFLASLALLAAACSGLPEPHTRVAAVSPEGTVPAGPVTVEIAFTAPVSPDGIVDGRRVALCRAADAAGVAAAASGDGLAPGAPVLAARIELLPGGDRARLVPDRPLWPMGAWAVVVGVGLRDAEGREVLDPAGRKRALRREFQTGDLDLANLPPLALTEALARAASPEAGGEYAEVANRGTAPVDLAGFRLAKRAASGVPARCTIEPGSGGPLGPGGRAIVAGGAWDGRYPLPAGTPLYRCGATALLGGLADDRPVALALESPGGALLAGLGWAEEAPLCASGPLALVDPAGPDAAANLGCPGTPSPGY